MSHYTRAKIQFTLPLGNFFYLDIEAARDPNRKTKETNPWDYDPIVLYKTGGEADGTVYTDHLRRWDRKKHDELSVKHFGTDNHLWASRSPEGIQSFLRDYLDAPNLILTLVEEQCHPGTGYAEWRFDYCKNPTV